MAITLRRISATRMRTSPCHAQNELWLHQFSKGKVKRVSGVILRIAAAMLGAINCCVKSFVWGMDRDDVNIFKAALGVAGGTSLVDSQKTFDSPLTRKKQRYRRNMLKPRVANKAVSNKSEMLLTPDCGNSGDGLERKRQGWHKMGERTDGTFGILGNHLLTRLSWLWREVYRCSTSCPGGSKNQIHRSIRNIPVTVELASTCPSGSRPCSFRTSNHLPCMSRNPYKP